MMNGMTLQELQFPHYRGRTPRGRIITVGFRTDHQRRGLVIPRYRTQCRNRHFNSRQSMPRISFCQRISLPVVVVYSAAIKSEQEALVEIETMPQMSADASARRHLEFT